MGPTRQRERRAGPPVRGARARGAAGPRERRERGREWAEPAQEGKGGGSELFLGFSFYKTFSTLFISFLLLFVL